MTTTNYQASPVVIVGAGPVGLYCAARLGALGISVILLDKKEAIVRQGSKALCVQADVLDLLDNVDCKKSIMKSGCHWDTSITHVGNTKIRKTQFKGTEAGSPAFINLPQWQVEEFLLESALNTNNVCVEWGATLDSLRVGDDGVHVSYIKGECKKNVHGSSVVGADGVRSKVRELLDIGWLGKVHGDCFLIVDVKMDMGWPKERRFWFDAPSNSGRQIVIHPQPDNTWRLDWQLPPDAIPEKEITKSSIADRLSYLTGGVEFELIWASTYNFHQRHADRLRVGNAFLIGDAAHALPPFGARGMNSGLQDAENLAWKLAAVINKRADESLLDTFNDERLRAAKENVQITGRTIRFMVPPTAMHRLYRNTLLRLTRRFPILNKLVNSGKMSTPTLYKNLPAFGTADDGKLSPGTLIPNLIYGSTSLRRLVSRGFTLITTSEYVPTESARDAMSLQLVRVPKTLTGELGNLYKLMAAESCQAILVRPDGYIAAKANTQIARMLDECMSRHGLKSQAQQQDCTQITQSIA